MIFYAILFALPALTLATEVVTVAQLFSDFYNSIDLNKDGDTSTEEVVTTLNAIDTNHDGEIDFDEFSAYLHTINSNFKGREPDVFRFFVSKETDKINIAKITAEN
uniref:EF-hand domain-containing protein n=1 Tax=Arion vulgaris TaxID=1028688 RepID=A0A0B6ZLJ0_9EUPU